MILAHIQQDKSESSMIDRLERGKLVKSNSITREI